MIEQHLDTLAYIEPLNNGKSLFCYHDDVALVAKYLRPSGGWTDKIYTAKSSTPVRTILLTL